MQPLRSLALAQSNSYHRFMTSPRKVQLDGMSVPLIVRRNRQARRILTRIDTRSGSVVLVLPPGASEAQGHEFLHKHAEWLRRRLSELPLRIPFADQATIPFRGQPHRICLLPAGPQRVQLADGSIEAGGRPGTLAKRLGAWFRAEARTTILPLATEKATAIDRIPDAVSIRDQKSRWGSCSSSGRLSFSWRLIMAPHHILDYVVAHEAAHLAQMNHSSSFWAIVARLTDDSGQARDWLKCHGASLHRYG